MYMVRDDILTLNLGSYKTEEEARTAYLKKRNESENRKNN